MSWAVGAAKAPAPETSQGSHARGRTHGAAALAGRGRGWDRCPPTPCRGGPLSPGLPAGRRELSDAATRWQHRRLLPGCAPGSGPPGTGSQTPAGPAQPCSLPALSAGRPGERPAMCPRGRPSRGFGSSLNAHPSLLQHASCRPANPSLPRDPGGISVPARQAGRMQDHQAAVPWTLSGGCPSLCSPHLGPGWGRSVWSRFRTHESTEEVGAGDGGRGPRQVDVGPALSPGALKPLGGLQGQAAQV